MKRDGGRQSRGFVASMDNQKRSPPCRYLVPHVRSTDTECKQAVCHTFFQTYICFPFSLIGGHVDGPSGTTIFGQGASLVKKLDVGVYSIRLMKPRNRNVSCS
jgi:hypothetical protein